MINGTHVVLYSKEAEAAEMAVHAGELNDRHELYLMCDDLNAELKQLQAKGVACSEVTEARWGVMSRIRLPGGGEIGLYEPKHLRPRKQG